MNRPFQVIAIGAGALLMPGAATAHHSEPNCSYGSNVLPEFVSVDAHRMFERCEGPKATLTLPNDRQVVVSYAPRKEAESASEAQTERQTRPRQSKRRCKKARKCRH